MKFQEELGKIYANPELELSLMSDVDNIDEVMAKLAKIWQVEDEFLTDFKEAFKKKFKSRLI